MAEEANAAQTAGSNGATAVLSAGADQTGAAAPGSAADQIAKPGTDAPLADGAKQTLADGDTKADGEDKKTDDKSAGAPEAYTDFTLPEGYTPDKDLIGEFGGWAKEHNLPQASAQKAIDLFTKAMGKATEAQQKGWEAMKDGWAKETTEDKDIGGVKWEDTKKSAVLAIEKLGSPKLMEVLEMSGVANHVEVVRFLSKIGGYVAEDKITTGGVKSDTLTPEQRAYPSMFKPKE